MGHHHEHGHHHSGVTLSRKLVLATTATLLFVLVELAAGLYANSLALIGNALHDFTDGLALILALVAVRLEQRPATEVMSFGYQRAGVLAAFINAGTLVAFTLFIFYEAFHRFLEPRAVESLPMIITAAVGILINGVITWSLRREGRHDVSIRSAVIHMFSDAISSAGIIVAAILIRVTGSPQWDAGLSVVIGVLILWSSWGILRETVNLLLEGTPQGIDPAEVTRALASLEGVEGVHHLHIWALAPSRPALSCHLLVGDVPVKFTTTLLDRVTELLHARYKIVHSTIQFEFAHCADDDPYCVPYTVQHRR
ncbi:MAG TPA: cation diffusion facilitator family transporter [Thermoanaerobaculia bacterium]|nr:cation diffusion facilitator family transporter [Thermoanaerobaculia bacterium]